MERKAKAYARKGAKEEALRHHELMKKALKTINVIALGIAAFNLLLILDYNLPKVEYEQRMIPISLNTARQEYYVRRSRHYDEIQFEDYTMRFDPAEVTGFNSYDKAVVSATILFNKPISVKITSKEWVREYLQGYGVGSAYNFMPKFMTLLLLLYFFIFRTLDSKLTISIFMIMMAIAHLIMFTSF